ncbi:MAG: hypothetical protein M1829_000483 [Trizodia sp. TS-e1964]|nr:MAG: hypothetical protein M1829_000483 [Trizodia sp. TS-e1964]
MFANKWYPPAVPTTDFSNQTVIITGANSGVGFEAAAHFHRLHAARLILAVRSPANGAAAKLALEQHCSHPCTIEVWPLDMARHASVRAFAARVASDLPRVDVVLLNAGMMAAEFHQSPQGWEDTLQVNTISTALLAALLVPVLRAKRGAGSSAPPHIVFVGSSMHRRGVLLEGEGGVLQRYNQRKKFDGRTAYANSKLLMHLAAGAVARRAVGESGEVDVVVTVVCPGFCVSALGRNYGLGVRALLAGIYFLMARSTEEGGRALVSAAGLGTEAHGRWWWDDKLVGQSPIVDGEGGQALQEQVLREIVDAAREEMPEVEKLF